MPTGPVSAQEQPDWGGLHSTQSTALQCSFELQPAPALQDVTCTAKVKDWGQLGLNLPPTRLNCGNCAAFSLLADNKKHVKLKPKARLRQLSQVKHVSQWSLMRCILVNTGHDDVCFKGKWLTDQ